MAGKQQPPFAVSPQPTTLGTEKQSRKRKTVLEVAMTKKRLEHARAQTRVNIGVAFPRWRQLRDSKGLKTDAMVAVFLLESYEKTVTSTPLVHGFTRPPPAAVFSDSKGQEIKSEGFGPWSSVSFKLEQVQEDADGNDSSSFSVNIIQVKQEDLAVKVTQEDLAVKVTQEDLAVKVTQEDLAVKVTQEDPAEKVKQEDPDESEFWCSGSMQQDPEMCGGVDASHPVPLTFNKLKEETDRYCGNVELLPSEHTVQTLKSEDLKTEEAIEEQSMDRKDLIKVCSYSISNQATHMQTNQVSSTTTKPASTVSELAVKGQCENCLILAKVREELQIQIAVLQNQIRAIICTKFSKPSVCSPHSDLDYGSEVRNSQIAAGPKLCIGHEQTVSSEIHSLSAISSLDFKTEQSEELNMNSDYGCEKLLKGFRRNCLGKNPLCKLNENTTQKVSHVRDFILYMAKGYPPIKTLLFLDNIERINQWVVTLQNGNMNVRHYLLDVLAFLKFLNRTSRSTAHLTRHSRNCIWRQLRQKLKDINTLIKSHKQTLKGSGENPCTPKCHVNKSTS